MNQIFGTGHQRLIDWLEKDWWLNGPPICVIEGFPGVGKTRIAEELLDRLGHRPIAAPMVECSSEGIGLLDDLMLALAEKLSALGDQRLAEALAPTTLKKILTEPVLLIIDELQQGFAPGTSKLMPSLYRLLNEIVGGGGRGRVLLLSSRDLERERANERWAVRPILGLPPKEAVELLHHLMEQEGVAEPIPQDRKADIATWLGGYPRALKLFVNRLRYEPMDNLLGVAHEAWEARDRTVSADLLAVELQ